VNLSILENALCEANLGLDIRNNSKAHHFSMHPVSSVDFLASPVGNHSIGRDCDREPIQLRSLCIIDRSLRFARGGCRGCTKKRDPVWHFTGSAGQPMADRPDRQRSTNLIGVFGYLQPPLAPRRFSPAPGDRGAVYREVCEAPESVSSRTPDTSDLLKGLVHRKVRASFVNST
jgi:hypothetical protein